MSKNNEPRVVVYCRNSVRGRHAANCDAQEEEVLAGLSKKWIDTTDVIVITDQAPDSRESDRPGFNRLRMMIARGEVDVLAVGSLRRMGVTGETGTFIAEFVAAGGRFIAVDDEIDSNEPGWETSLQFLGVSWTPMKPDIGQRIRRAKHKGLLANQSVGDVCFGYESYAIEPAIGGDGKERQSRPGRGVRIHPGEAEWVRQIFDWFVGAGLPMQRIAERLTEQNVPKPRGSKSRTWRARDIRQILTCSKYIGQWVWGRTTTVVDRDGKRRRVPVPEDQQIVVARPHLQIVDQATWETAQTKLRRHGESYGKKARGRIPQDPGIRQGRSRSQLNRLPWREPLRFSIICEVPGWDGNPIRVSLTQYVGLGKWKAYDEKGKETIVDGGLIRLLPQEP